MRHLRPIAMLLFAALLAACGQRGANTEFKIGDLVVREGDVVFQPFVDNPLTTMIEGATHSRYSHCGIVECVDGQWWVIEAIGPVTETRLEKWIARGRGGQVDVYRFAPKYDAKIPAILSAARTYLGRPYDTRFQMDDEKIYCSELLYKAFKTATGEPLGKLVKVRELDWRPYEKTIRELEQGEPPLDREMITPRDMANAEQLTRVFEGLR